MAEVVEEKEDDTVEYSEGILLMIFLLFVANAGGSFLKKKKHKFLQEAGFSTILGLFVGMILWLTNGLNSFDSVVKFNQDFFMIVLLPPIIFDSAYNMDKIYFFKNIGGILLYAILGTFVSAITIALMIYAVGAVGLGYGLTLIECFAFGALISATDPVSVLSIFSEMGADRDLYALVFGESIFNDAVTIVLYRTIIGLSKEGGAEQISLAFLHFFGIFFGSMVVGIFIGLIVALLMKKQYLGTLQAEVGAMFISPWISYLLAESMEMSGIVSILFCGIVVAKYCRDNLSPEARTASTLGYKSLAHAAETIVFIFLGFSPWIFDVRWGTMGLMLPIWAFLIIKFGRFVNVGGVTLLINKFRNKTKIDKTSQFVIWYSGLRGAIAFALAVNCTKTFSTDDGGNGDMILAMTFLYSAFTILVTGSTLNPVLDKCEVKDDGQEKEPFEFEKTAEQANICKRLKARAIYVDKHYITPFFSNSARSPDVSPRSSRQVELSNFNGSSESDEQRIDFEGRENQVRNSGRQDGDAI